VVENWQWDRFMVKWYRDRFYGKVALGEVYGKVALGQVYGKVALQALWFFPCQYHSTHVPYSFIYTDTIFQLTASLNSTVTKDAATAHAATQRINSVLAVEVGLVTVVRLHGAFCNLRMSRPITCRKL
jgi:hypothetical protein